MFQAFCIYRNTTKLSIFHCHKIRDDTAIATGGCPYQFGIYPLAACSPSYVKCAFGVPEEHPCDVGTVYDDRIHSCNWPDQVGRNIIRLSSLVCINAESAPLSPAMVIIRGSANRDARGQDNSVFNEQRK